MTATSSTALQGVAPAPAGVASVPIDLALVRAQCERVRAGLIGLRDWLPLRPLTGAALARWTGLKGPLCRRVLAAVQHAGDPAELARILPGVEGLTLLADALEERDCPADLLAPLRSSITAFADLLHRSGGSQRRLIAGVQEALGVVAPSGGAEDPDAEARRLHFEGTRRVTRAELRALVVVSVLARAPGERARELDSVSAMGQLGFRGGAGAMPLVARHFSSPGVPDVEDAAPDLQAALGTPGLGIERSVDRSGRTLLTYDGRGAEAPPVDLWAGPVFNAGITRFGEGGDNSYGTMAAIRTPARWLVHDLWVERPLARAASMRSASYRPTPGTAGQVDFERWYDRLPDEPRAHLEEGGPSPALLEASPSHAAVVDRCLAVLGRERSEFVCYRCVVEYPVWLTVHRLTLEFETAFDPVVA